MYEEEIKIWENKKRELEIKLWELIEQEYNLMQDINMIKSLIEEEKNEQ